MAKYSDYAKDGSMSPHEAHANDTVRKGARELMQNHIAETARDGLPADAAAFGALDVIAVSLVQFYGAEKAAEVLRHYAGVCERQGGPKQ